MKGYQLEQLSLMRQRNFWVERAVKQLGDNDQDHLIEQISDIGGDIPQFDPVLVPIEESLPSCLPTPSTQSNFVYITQCKEDMTL